MIVCALQGQLVGVALSFLRNFGILSGASGVLGALSSGVASAALDDRFAVQRAQQKQVSPVSQLYSVKSTMPNFVSGCIAKPAVPAGGNRLNEASQLYSVKSNNAQLCEWMRSKTSCTCWR